MIMFSLPYAEQLVRAHQEDLLRMREASRPLSTARAARRSRNYGPVRRRLGWSLVALGLRLAAGREAGGATSVGQLAGTVCPR
jgi:hypothetical protein